MTNVQTDKKIKMCKLYGAAYIRELEKAIQEDKEKHSNIIKLVYYGVKMVNTLPEFKDKEQAENHFTSIIGLKGSMKLLTLQEFMTIFSIEKKYDGHKHEIKEKDYFSTVKAINELKLQPNEPIGERINDLLLDYMNWDILRFNAKNMIVVSALRQFEGHLDVFEEFMASRGITTRNTFKNDKGEVMYVRYGKLEKIKMNEQQHDHLKLVK